MHLLLPFAAPAAPAFQKTLATLVLPNLAEAMALAQLQATAGSDETTLSPPHEAAQAALQGWQGLDGNWPTAAELARADGLPVPDGTAWALLTPGHWQASADDVVMLPPEVLALTEASSRAALAAVTPLLLDSGWALHYGAPTRWYAQHPSFAPQTHAALDRVVGGSVQPWLLRSRTDSALRRLQSEVQMLLYTHPLNDEREARGQWALNSFWLSGTGVAQASAIELVVDRRLQAPAQAGDAAAWAQAWQAFDAQVLPAWLKASASGARCSLTLCGERLAQTYVPARRSWLQRATQGWRRTDLAALLGGL